MAEFWSSLMQFVMPVMIGVLIWFIRTEAQKSARILTQQAVHETRLEHIDKRIGRLEGNGSQREGR